VNLVLWELVREYIDAEVKLGIKRNMHRQDLAPGSTVRNVKIQDLEEQSTRIETAIRAALTAGEKRG
jgi:hypothetical protein